MKCSLGISNFFEEIPVFPILLFSSISLHWSLRKAFLSLLAIVWNSAFRCLYLSFSPLLFASLLFTAICKMRGRKPRRSLGPKPTLSPEMSGLRLTGLSQVPSSYRWAQWDPGMKSEPTRVTQLGSCLESPLLTSNLESWPPTRQQGIKYERLRSVRLMRRLPARLNQCTIKN